MERDVERKAVAKAWSYLRYSAGAKWAALGAAAGAGLLYLALLVVLGLFADLMVYQGHVPAFRDLTPVEQVNFQQEWDRLPEGERLERLQHLGLDEPLARKFVNAATPAEQALFWRSQVCWLIRTRVGGSADLLLLPSYRDLPPALQTAFAAQWRPPPLKVDAVHLSVPGMLLDLPATGFPPALPWGTLVPDSPAPPRPSEKIATNEALLTELEVDPARVHHLATADPAALPPDEQEFLWRAFVYKNLRERVNRDVLRSRTSLEAAQLTYADEWHDGGLADRGVLASVVRMQVYNQGLSRVYSATLGWLARWNPWLWKRGNSGYLTGLLVVAFMVALVRGGLLFVNQEMAARATIEAATRLRRAVYHHTFRLGTLAIKALGPSEAVSIFTRHVEAVHDALYARLTACFREPIKFFLLLVFALIVHFWLALAFLLFTLLVWLVGGQVATYFKRKGRTAVSEAAEQLTLLRECLMLMRLVKVYLMELFNQARVERQLSRYAAAQQRRFRGEAIYRPLLLFLGVLATIVLLYVAGLIVFQGHLSVPSAIVLSTALVSLYGPLQAWLEERKVLRRGRESAVLVFRFLDRPGEVGQVVGAEFLPPLAKLLEFDHVSLREPGTVRMLLNDVSFTVKAGQHVALVGADDLEKHALAYLIPRFLDPTAGEIRSDGHNLRWITLDSLRAQIAVVLQHNLIFHDTVIHNIGCGDPSYTLPQIIEAAKIAHAHNFILKLPRGYETVIGELSHPLSTAEQFRIALARAILRDPALLIIEEPVTPLDDDTKALLDDTFTRFLPGRTTIFLPHRLSTIKSCDRVLLLHKGKLEGAGEHRELLANNMLYRHLHYLEFNELTEQMWNPERTDR